MLSSSVQLVPIVTTLTITLLALKGILQTLFSPSHAPPEPRKPRAYSYPEVALDGDLARDARETFVADGVSAFACSKASGSTNFDFFGMKRSSSGLVSFYLGDVSGKGLSASLCQVACVSSLKLASSISVDPVGIVSEVNESLSRRGIEGRFATLIYGTLDATSGRLRLLSAGHHKPIRISRNNQAETLDCPPCLPVGILAEHKYVLTEHRLEPGDTLLLYSDGITEARDRSRVFWGEARLAEAAQRFHSPLPRHLVKNIFEQVQDFSYARKDDQTILAIHYSGLRSEFATETLERVPDHQLQGCLA